MDIPQIGTPLGTIFITCCLWQWTIRKGKAHIFQQEVLLREQNRSASWAFCASLIIELVCLFTNPSSWMISLLCFTVFIAFAITSNRDSESFWRKRRNVLVAGTISGVSFGVAPYAFTEIYFVPLLCSFLIAHVAHRTFLTIFSSNLRDLKSLQSKLLKYDSEQRNRSVLSKDDNVTLDFNEVLETSA